MADRLSSDEQNKKIAFITLGCSKNRVDSEVMLGFLAAAGGFTLVEPEEAESVVVSTCGFIDDAKQEAIETILEAAELKKTGPLKQLVVAGCLPVLHRAELQNEIPEIDAIITPNELEKLPRILAPERKFPTHLMERPYESRILTTPPHYAYLRIADGCDRNCAFCTIPAIRGPMKSRTMDSILREALVLAERGVKELLLVAQDTSAYGLDQGGQRQLAGLVRNLTKLEGIEWLRIHYLYPSSIDEELIDLITGHPKVLPYVDLPLQHANAGVLRAMHRPGDAKIYRELLEKFRAKNPDTVLRTTFIVGHPGESDSAFDELLLFMNDVQFDRVGAFLFQPQEGTASAALSAPERDATLERLERLFEFQAPLSAARLERLVGRELTILLDEAEDSGLSAEGRSFGESPEVDGVVVVAGTNLRAGEFITARITDSEDHDLIAEQVEARS